MREVIDRIKAAEKEAEDIKRRARQKVELDAEKARDDGRKHVEDAVMRANAAARQLIRKAEIEGTDTAEKRVKAAGEDAIRIMELSEGRLEQAAHEIVKGIMENI